MSDPSTRRAKVPGFLDAAAVAYLEPMSRELEPQDALLLVDIGFRLPGARSPPQGVPILTMARFAKLTIWQTEEELERNEGMVFLQEPRGERVGEAISSL